MSFTIRETPYFFGSHFSDSIKRRVGVTDLHCGDVFAREGIGGVADEQTCLTHSPRRRDERKTVIWRDKDKACWLLPGRWKVVYNLAYKSESAFHRGA